MSQDKNAADFAEGLRKLSEGMHGEDIFSGLLGFICGIYSGAPTHMKLRLTHKLLSVIKAEYGIDIKGMVPNDPEAHKRERDRIDRDLERLPGLPRSN